MKMDNTDKTNNPELFPRNTYFGAMCFVANGNVPTYSSSGLAMFG